MLYKALGWCKVSLARRHAAKGRRQPNKRSANRKRSLQYPSREPCNTIRAKIYQKFEPYRHIARPAMHATAIYSTVPPANHPELQLYIALAHETKNFKPKTSGFSEYRLTCPISPSQLQKNYILSIFSFLHIQTLLLVANPPTPSVRPLSLYTSTTNLFGRKLYFALNSSSLLCIQHANPQHFSFLVWLPFLPFMAAVSSSIDSSLSCLMLRPCPRLSSTMST